MSGSIIYIKVPGNYANARIELIDMNGKIVQTNISTLINGQIEFQTSEISTGIYFLRLSSKGKVYHNKIVIQ